jgi:hypothetical protein
MSWGRKGVRASGPPPDLGALGILKDCGVRSVIMSLEIWNEVNRAKWCLGKHSVTKQQYFSAWAEALRLFGEGQVASVLLVGAEDAAETYRGAETLIRAGVVPTLIPLRPYETSRFAGWNPVAAEAYVDLERQVGALLQGARLFPSRQSGCTGCGGCSLETAVEGLVTLPA